jgi:Bacteriophage minor capsid protein
VPGISNRLLSGIAQYLASAGVARYSATGAYTGTGLPAVFTGALPDAPAAAICLVVYDDDRDRDDWNPDLYVQIRARAGTADPRPTDDLSDLIFDTLHNAEHYLLAGGQRVLLSRRTIRTQPTMDDAKRWSRADSYRFTLNPVEA